MALRFAHLLLLGTIPLFATCRERVVADQPPAEISFGPLMPLKGKAAWGIEDVYIVLCEGDRAKCDIPTDPRAKRYCALDFSDAGAQTLKNLKFERDETGAPAGEVWIEGTGRRSVSHGGFGHLSQHDCLVLFDNVKLVERGPPWLFEAPPPE